MSAMTNVQEEEDAVGGLINSDGKELEWDPGRSNRRSLDSSCCCHVCGKKFLNTRALQRHQRTHAGAKPHKCSHCGTAFSVLNRLKRHHLIHTKERSVSSPVCDTRFSRKDRLKEHLRIHGCSAKAKEAAEALGGVETADATVSSDTSRLEIKSAGNRPLHHHGNQENHAADNHSQTSVWNGGHYTAFIPLDQNPNMSHWSAAEGHRAYGAPGGASIHFSALLRGTVEQEHFKESCPAEQPSWPSGTSSVSPPSEPGLTTPLPHNTTSKKMHLSEMDPELNHHEEHRPEMQDQDDRTEPTEAFKGPEPESSSNEQPQEKPSEGPKQCRGLRRLKKNYNCPTCGRVFSHNPALQRHLVIHSGKRPFKCFICGRGFTQSGNLKTHMKVHKGELPNWTLVQEKSPPKESPVTVHVCGECGMDFSQKQQLEAHCQSYRKHLMIHDKKPKPPAKPLGRPKQ
ncbi:hypothetical protein PFLUV_G00004120 [Perca fluviatilis]|uniref:C2H2-type domain-containing protein n=1 Tax=Perca fluviatilis TaxID=8168 RepID=A0A6A5FQD2_PERFL|nr:hypothetical protein PFLUV_G00004120 [Perca fluviatilis]